MSLGLTIQVEALKKAVAALEERVRVLEGKTAANSPEPTQIAVHATRKRGRPRKEAA